MSSHHKHATSQTAVGIGQGASSNTAAPFVSSSSSSSSSSSTFSPSSTLSPSSVLQASPTAATSTTSSVSRPSVSGTSSSHSHSGYSAGSLAGAIVGSALGAAVITFVLTFLLLRRQNMPSGFQFRRRDKDDRGKHSSKRPPPPVPKKSTFVADNSDFHWQAYLPQGADDSTLRNAVKTLFDQIELHVDNYYHRANIEIDDEIRHGLTAVEPDAALPAAIDELMQHPHVALAVIKHCITGTLLARISPSADFGRSLLPLRLAEAPTKLTGASLSPNEAMAVGQAYSQWRLLNAYLFPHPGEGLTYLQDRDFLAKEISQLLSTAFAPWQRPSEEPAALHHHEGGLVASAASVGILILSQPCAYEFSWNADRRPSTRDGDAALVTFPGFAKASDEKGRPLERPQLLVSPAVLPLQRRDD